MLSKANQIFAIFCAAFITFAPPLLSQAKAESVSAYSYKGLQIDAAIADQLTSDNLSVLGFVLQCTYESAYLHPKGFSRGHSWPTVKPRGNFVIIVADQAAEATFNYVVTSLEPSSELINLVDKSDSWDDAAIFFDVDQELSFDMSVSGNVNLDFADNWLSISGIRPFIRQWDSYGPVEPHQVMNTVSIDRTTGAWQTALRSGDLGGQAKGVCDVIKDEGKARLIGQSLMSSAFNRAISAFNATVVSGQTLEPKKF